MRKVSSLFLSLFLIVGLIHATISQAQFFIEENPLLHKQAPNFKLPTLSGQQLSLSDFRGGQSAIVFFWATWCPHCRAQLKGLNAMKADIEAKGIKVLLVDLGEKAQQVSSYTQKNNITYEVFLDEDSKVADEYNLIGVPTFFFIGADGVIKAVDFAMPSNYVEILATGNKAS